MAPVTYYFLFSLIFASMSVLYLVNLMLLRADGKTTFGLSYKPGTPEYKRVIRLASNRNIAIMSGLAIVLMANFVWNVYEYIHRYSSEYITGLFWLSIGTIVLGIITCKLIPKQLGINNH